MTINLNIPVALLRELIDLSRRNVEAHERVAASLERLSPPPLAEALPRKKSVRDIRYFDPAITAKAQEKARELDRLTKYE